MAYLQNHLEILSDVELILMQRLSLREAKLRRRYLNKTKSSQQMTVIKDQQLSSILVFMKNFV